MSTHVQWPTSSSLERRLNMMQAMARPGGPSFRRAQTDIQIIAERDHEEKMLSGIDRHGRPRAALAPSTLAKRKRGPNPQSLVPHGFASRFIMNYVAEWVGNALVQKFVGIVDKKGRSFAQYHLTGASKPGTRWVLPKRDVGGITPKGWRQIVERHKQFAADVLKGK